MLEPWLKDSSIGFERRYATLQSIRRRAVLHVKPQVDGGYLVDLAVYKELEDVHQPEFSTVNVEELRHDATLQRPGSELPVGSLTRGWIPVGRDTMSTQMLADLHRAPGRHRQGMMLGWLSKAAARCGSHGGAYEVAC